MSSPADVSADFVVVGGGIAGVSCVQMLAQLCHSEPRLKGKKVLLLSATQAVKRVANLSEVTERLAAFDVEEAQTEQLEKSLKSGVTVIRDVVVSISPDAKTVSTQSGTTVGYSKLCLCHGARPKMVQCQSSSKYVRGIRDTESVRDFQRDLAGAKRVLIVGNGGIATELVHELKDVEIVWCIKDDSISAAFVDAGAGQFFLDEISEDRIKAKLEEEEPRVKRLKYTGGGGERNESVMGGALGPDWHRELKVTGANSSGKRVRVEYESELKEVFDLTENNEESHKKESLSKLPESDRDKDWRLLAVLSNGKTFGCDLIVSATGVIPNGDLIKCESLELDQNSAIKVNNMLETSVTDVYAAGDVCGVDFGNEMWFQMRLWTQARQLGMYAAQTMTGLATEPDFCFEVFTHATKFFGYKVILLGLFNGQTLNVEDYEALVRVTRGKEYVKCVMQNGKMKGAVLVGETDLEETFENLILNQMDLSHLGEDLLNPNVDIEDYFD